MPNSPPRRQRTCCTFRGLRSFQILDGGRIEYRRVGNHRRVRFDALMKHKRQAEAARRAALAELAAYDQELEI